MTKKDFFTKLSGLIGQFKSQKFEDAKPEAEKPEEVKPEAEVKPETEVKPEEVKPEEKKEGEPEAEKTEEEKKEELAKQAPAVDYAAIQAELVDLRRKVQVLDEYTYLKDRQKQLEDMVQTQAQSFASALELFQEFLKQPTAEPVGKIKSGIVIDDKSAERKQTRDEWVEAFSNLKPGKK